MENKTDIIENFQQYVTDLINGKVGKNIKLEFEELKTLNNLHLTFNYLTNYENDEDYAKNIDINEVFKESNFYIKSYHEDTHDYNELIQKHPEIKKLANYEQFVCEPVTERYSMSFIQDFYIKEDRVVHFYQKIGLIKNFKADVAFQFLKYDEFGYKGYASLPGVTKQDDGYHIPARYFKELFPDVKDEPCEVIMYRNGNKVGFLRIDGLNKVTKTNFFNNVPYKIFSAKGEIEDPDAFDYTQVAEQLRHSIAHGKLKSFELDNEQKVWLAKLDIKENGKNEPVPYVIVMLNEWFTAFMDSDFKATSSKFNFINIPKLTKPIKTPEDLDEVLKDTSVLQFELDDYGANINAFKAFIKKYNDAYINDKNIKKRISDYLGNIVLKYYDGIKLNKYPFENVEIFKNRILSDMSFFKLKPSKKTVETKQFEMMTRFANEIYPDCLVVDGIFNSSQYRYPSTLAHKFVKEYFYSYINSFASKKLHVDIPVCSEIETAVAYCQFLIFYRLVFTKNYEFWKTIDNKQTLNIDYYNTPEGKELLKINELDMSKFIITSNQKNQTQHAPTNFDEQLLVLRLLRNAVCHGNVKFSLEKNGGVFDHWLHLTSLEHPKNSISVKIKHLMKFLNLPFFKNNSNNIPPSFTQIKVDDIKTEIDNLIKI